MSGRSEARVSQTDVRIDVATHSSGAGSRTTTIRPIRTRNQQAAEPESGEDDGFPSIIPPGGVLPDEGEEREQPAEEAAPLSSRMNRQTATRLASGASSAPIRAGWSTNPRSSSTGARQTARPRNDANAGADSRDEPARSESIGREYDDDGENPLPPALEPGESAASASNTREDGRRSA